MGHFKRDCSFRDKVCTICREQGPLSNTCRKTARSGGGESSRGGASEEKEQPAQPKMKLVSFAKSKRNQAREEVNMVQELEAMRMREKAKERGGVYMFEESGGRPTVGSEAEWMVDSGSSLTVCNDLNLMWDVIVHNHPIEPDQLSGGLQVYVEGTFKLTTFDHEGNPMDLVLQDVIYVPESKVNIFSERSMRAGNIRKLQPQRVGVVWIQREDGKIVGSFQEDSKARTTLVYKTKLPPTYAKRMMWREGPKITVEPDEWTTIIDVEMWGHALESDGYHMNLAV